MKQSKRIFAVLLAGVLSLSLAACGGAAGSAAAGDATRNEAYTTAPSTPMEPSAAAPSLDYYYSDYVKDYDSPAETESPAAGGTVYNKSDVKLIRRATLTIQTTEFDQSLTALDALVAEVGGYYESAELYSGSYNEAKAYRSANYVIRVPAQSYDAFINQTDGVGHLSRKVESSEDVGEIYYDIEARLATQRTKQERLLELLKKAENMEDIIKLDSALTDVEYQIEQYTSSLKRYDGLIGYATFNVNLNEVYKIVDEPTQRESLFTRMAAGFASSLDDLVEGFQDLMIWFSYNVFGLVIWGVVLVVLFAAVRKKVRSGGMLRRKKRSEIKETSSEHEEKE